MSDELDAQKKLAENMAELREVTAQLNAHLAYADLVSAMTTREVVAELIEHFDWRGDE